MNSKLFIILTIPLFVATGCTSSPKPWVKDNTPRSEADQAMADCKYQAQAATIGIGSNDRPKNMTDAIGQGIGDGIVQAMDQAELVKSCMEAKGFTQ
ncbi:MULTISPECIES: hypothetical protein [Brucella/Ochrobactrum group]|uniref:Lipoprotein n=1 Tax=Brucella pseudintermedia TaxID=370111 RepID=A0ABY5UEH2_9HYPH|nr:MULTISPECIES: hypothetical protein [Brucella/Ochrobactrum group]KAB2681022.1 hypothetical protein F9K78_15615 [Brucella pseudintermedia]NKE75283.1 hypothetical protein [Ochrobactrum sp. MC-1LL]UWL61736.1 hypothetical protein NIK97_17800 [Brucella pseudintermedia]